MIEMKIAYIRHGKIKLIVFAVLLALLGLFALHSAGRSAALNASRAASVKLPIYCTDNENQNHDQRHACNDDRQIGFLENLHLGALFPPGIHRLLGGLFIHRAFHLSCILLSL